MTSIMTNNAAMAALQTLRSINSNMETTQNRISSGYRVDTAKDNSAYWAIATTMRSDNKALSTVEDALGLGAAKVDTAYTGMESAIDVVSEIKAKLVAAREPGVDKNKINAELDELKNQLISVADSASFSGENWLKNTSTTANLADGKEIVGSFNRSATGTVSLTTLNVDISSTVLVNTADEASGILTRGYLKTDPTGTATNSTTTDYKLLDLTGSATAASAAIIELDSDTKATAIEQMISVVDRIFSLMTDAASNLGAVNSRIEMQEEFVSGLMDSIDMGIGRLVDADMNEESTRLKALQTQQQLGIQALSIANSSSDSLMQLFR